MGRYARNSIGQYAPVGAAADDLPGGATPTGKKTIDTTAEVDVASYATAQVVDDNLVAGNIKKDVTILGTTGSYEGGSSDFSTAEVVVTNNSNSFVTILIPNIVEGEDAGITNAGYPEGSSPLTLEVPVYKGFCFCLDPFSVDGPPVTVTVTGDITWNSETMLLTITGDGTITLS